MIPELFQINPANPRNIFFLNGSWQLEPGLETVPKRFSHTVSVPGLVDLAQPAYDWRNHDYHWYKKTFSLTTKGQLNHCFLRIDQSQYGTAVWVNGRHMGDSISCYTSHEYRIDEAVRWNGENELVVRVGSKRTLPPESAVGKDQEREEFIPGIWGDVSLVMTSNPRIKRVQIIPHIGRAVAEARIWVENLSDESTTCELISRVLEGSSSNARSKPSTVKIGLPPRSTECITLQHHIDDLHLWNPDSPFLYELAVELIRNDLHTDRLKTKFGMREFKIQGKGFYLNGKRVFLKGGNIGFHRFLSDKERSMLPWDRAWIKRVLVDIPKAHHFNFFRNHLGQMYNAWYHIADEHGMLIQNEWQFWGTTGSKDQIMKEFTEWVQDNWNHPSIIMWDPLNESTDDAVQKEIVPEMKKLDPTRPWESVDVVEEHPYIYSLGPVLNDRKFGFIRPLAEVEKSNVPTVFNEFLWWWLRSDGEPTALMKDVVERWLGPSYSKEELLRHQAFLAQELVELFRRMRIDAIQPFVYLSNNEGATAHWFTGSIRDLRPKPILTALKNAFSPFGVSLELWDRHFFPGERRRLNAFVFNDLQRGQGGTITYGVMKENEEWVLRDETEVIVPSSEFLKIPLDIIFPKEAGTYWVCAELTDGTGARVTSRKISQVVAEPTTPAMLTRKHIVALESGNELKQFLSNKGISVLDFSTARLNTVDVIVVSHGQLQTETYHARIHEVTKFVEEGGALIVIEPEYGEKSSALEVLDRLRLEIQRREDVDRGGYDSYIFADDHAHPLWEGIRPDHLKMFNGAYGGEVVSQHNVSPSIEPNVHARCGLGLRVPAVMEIEYGNGAVWVSRLQVRNRLHVPEEPLSLYAHRIDPVLQGYVLNLLGYATHRALQKRAKATVSNVQH